MTISKQHTSEACFEIRPSSFFRSRRAGSFVISPHMRARSEIISLLTNPGPVALVRPQRPGPVGPLLEALIGGGITAGEITMPTPDALAVMPPAINAAN